MIKRVVFDVGAVALLLFTPWWVVFIYVLMGIVLFPWYLEAIFLGLFFDVIYGIPSLHWYQRVTHTLVFIVPLIIGEFIKRRINI